MKREISEEIAHAYDAGYRIGYRQAKRDFRDLIERDKAKNVIEKSVSLDGCPVCDCVLENWAVYSFCTHCGQRLKSDDDESKS